MEQRQTTPFGLIFLLWFAGLGAAAQFGKVAISLTDIAPLYPDAGNSISFVVSIIGTVGIIFGATAGIAVNRLGHHRVLVLALIFGALMSAYQASFPALPLMLASRVFEGVSHLFIVVAAPTLMAQLSAPQHKSIVMGLWGSFFGIAFALVAWLGIPLINSAGPGALFLAHAGFMGIVAVLVFVFLPRGVGGHAQNQSFDIVELLDAHRQIYINPATALPGLTFVWHTIMYLALLTYLPTLASPEARAGFATLLPMASILGTLSSGFITQKLISPRRACIAGFSGSALLMIALALTGPDYSVFFGLSMMLMLTAGFVAGSVFAMVPAINDTAQNQARANGAIAQLGNVGTSTGTPLFAFTLAAFGFFGLSALVFVICLGGIVVLLTLGHPKRLGSR